MIKDCIAVLDIDSSKITFIIGERSVNGAFAFRYKEHINTDTFYESAFFDVTNLEKAIVDCYQNVLKSQNIQSISKIYVSVAGEFTKTISKSYRMVFNKPKKITSVDLLELYNLGEEKIQDYTLINRTAVYYQVGSLKTHKPIGEKGESLAGRLSYVYVLNYFKEIIDNIFHKIGVSEVYYISSLFAKCNTLFTQAERDNTLILIDIGYTTTEIAIASGNGILYNDAFSFGGAMITAYLSSDLGADYLVSEKITEQLNLGYVDNPSALYVISDKDGDFTFSRDRANAIGREVLDKLAEKIIKSISNCPLKVPSDIVISFTGSGICNIRGACEYLSSRLSTYNKVVKPAIPHYNKPWCSGFVSLLDTALSLCKDKVFFVNNKE